MNVREKAEKGQPMLIYGRLPTAEKVQAKNKK